MRRGGISRSARHCAGCDGGRRIRHAHEGSRYESGLLLLEWQRSPSNGLHIHVVRHLASPHRVSTADKKDIPARGIPMPHLSVLFSLYFNSAAHPKHGMFAFAPLLGHSERRATDQSTDLVLDMPMSASPLVLRCDVTWLPPLRRFAPQRPASPSRLTLRDYPWRCKSIRISIG